MKTLRLKCLCGRNIADVTRHPELSAPAPELRGLMVASRPGVARQPADRSWYYRPAIGGAYVPPSYTWWCRCGRNHTRRHDALVDAWAKHYDPTRRVVTVILDRDL